MFDNNVDPDIDTTTKVAMASSVYCLLCLGLPMPIIATVIAVAQSGNMCQNTDAIGLNLSQWLLSSGIVGMASVLALVTLLIMAFCYNSAALAIAMTALTIIVSLFNLVYSIIGSIVLFRSNSACLNQGTDLGVCALLVLIFAWISILIRICNCPRNNSS